MNKVYAVEISFNGMASLDNYQLFNEVEPALSYMRKLIKHNTGSADGINVGDEEILFWFKEEEFLTELKGIRVLGEGREEV